MTKRLTEAGRIMDSLRRPTESGRYAERGYNDDFNDGLDALWIALEDADLVKEYEDND